MTVRLIAVFFKKKVDFVRTVVVTADDTKVLTKPARALDKNQELHPNGDSLSVPQEEIPRRNRRYNPQCFFVIFITEAPKDACIIYLAGIISRIGNQLSLMFIRNLRPSTKNGINAS